MQQVIEEEKPAVEALQKEVDEAKREMVSLHDDLENQLPKIHKIKKEIKALRVKEKQQQLILDNHIDEIEHLEPQIVRSPERIKKDLKLRSKRIEQQTIEVAGSKVKYSRDFRKLNVLKEMDGTIKERINEMKHLHSLREEHRGLEDQIKGLKIQRRKLNSEMHSVQRSKKTIKENLTENKKIYETLKVEKDMKQNQVNQLLESVRKEQDRSSRIKISREQQIHTVEQNILATKEDIEQLKGQHRKSIEIIQGKYGELNKSVSQYHAEMRLCMEQW